MSKLQRAIRKWVPAPYQPAMNEVHYTLRAVLNSGTQRVCPCCGWHLRAFLPKRGSHSRSNAICPRCNSRERHRWLWFYLQQNQPNLFTAPTRLLHFAPEYCLTRRFNQMPNLTAIGVDLNPRTFVKARTDITKIAFSDSAFDGMICNHVLEHIPDDRRAMQELFRVLKPGGWAVINVPIKLDRETVEDPTIVSPQERERAFGQSDHVRLYGSDYVERLRAAGFTVQIHNTNALDSHDIEKYGLLKDDLLFFCTKS